MQIKDGAHVRNLDEYLNIGTHWVTLWVDNSNNVTYFDFFGVENISKKLKNLSRIKT